MFQTMSEKKAMQLLQNVRELLNIETNCVWTSDSEVAEAFWYKSINGVPFDRILLNLLLQ